MRLPTVKLQHKINKTRITVNETDWAQDLGRGKYHDYECISNTNAGNPDDVINVKQPKSETIKESEKENKPDNDYVPSDDMKQAINDAAKLEQEAQGQKTEPADPVSTDTDTKPSTSIGAKKKKKLT